MFLPPWITDLCSQTPNELPPECLTQPGIKLAPAHLNKLILLDFQHWGSLLSTAPASSQVEPEVWRDEAAAEPLVEAVLISEVTEASFRAGTVPGYS